MSAHDDDASLLCPKCRVSFDIHEFCQNCDGEESMSDPKLLKIANRLHSMAGGLSDLTMEDILTALEQAVAEERRASDHLANVLRGLTEKVERIGKSEAFLSLAAIAAVHGCAYRGENWSAEIERARIALAARSAGGEVQHVSEPKP